MGNSNGNAETTDGLINKRSYFSVVPAEVLVTKSPKIVIDKRLSKIPERTIPKSPKMQRSLWKKFKEYVIPKPRKVPIKKRTEVKFVTKTKSKTKPEVKSKVTPKVKLEVEPKVIPKEKETIVIENRDVDDEKPAIVSNPTPLMVEIKKVELPSAPLPRHEEVAAPKVQSNKAEQEDRCNQTIVFKPEIKLSIPQSHDRPCVAPVSQSAPISYPAPVIVQAPPINIKQSPKVKTSTPAASPMKNTMKAPCSPEKTQNIHIPQGQPPKAAFEVQSKTKRKKKAIKPKQWRHRNIIMSSSSDDLHEAIWQELRSLRKKISSQKGNQKQSNDRGDGVNLNQTFPMIAPSPQYISTNPSLMVREGARGGGTGHGPEKRMGHPRYFQRGSPAEISDQVLVSEPVIPPKGFRNKKTKRAAVAKTQREKKKKANKLLGKMFPISERGLYERLLDVGHPEPDKMPDQSARPEDLVDVDNPAPPWADADNYEGAKEGV